MACLGFGQLWFNQNRDDLLCFCPHSHPWLVLGSPNIIDRHPSQHDLWWIPAWSPSYIISTMPKARPSVDLCFFKQLDTYELAAKAIVQRKYHFLNNVIICNKRLGTRKSTICKFMFHANSINQLVVWSRLSAAWVKLSIRERAANFIHKTRRCLGQWLWLSW